MNILITGAFGFVGTNLCLSLKSKPHNFLIAVDIIPSTSSNIYNKFYSWTELDKINLSNVDVIIHLAGKAHDINNVANPKSYFDINVGLTKQIFDFFLASTATKFIFFSSVKAVADSVIEGTVLTEETPCNPKTPYGESKRQA
jgi:nucleoside-diphosphate-sugar epimerase